MQVTVKLFATLNKYSPEGLPGAPFTLELPEGAEVRDVVERLNIPREETKIVFVNGVVCALDKKLQPDDQIGIFPPIGGG